MGAEMLWEVRAYGADDKHTVSELRQDERRGYCQSMTAASDCGKHPTPAGSFSCKISPQTVKHLHAESSPINSRLRRSCSSLGKEVYILYLRYGGNGGAM